MKKFIITTIMVMMCFVSNAQNCSFNIGADYIFDPSILRYESINVCGQQFGVNAGLTYRVRNDIYAGVGVGVGCYNVSAHENSMAISSNLFILPFYVDAYRSQENSMFYEIKIGGALISYDDLSETDFYFSIIPLGYTFGNSISVGVGMRYLSQKDAKDCVGIATTVKYTF